MAVGGVHGTKMYRRAPKLSITEIIAWRYDLPDHPRRSDTMITILDLKAEFGKLAMMRGRRPETLEAERQKSGAFSTLAPYRDGNLYSAKFAGNGAWERHPNGDELVQVVEGETILHIITADGPQTHALKAGMLVVVPQGAWHRFEAPDGVALMTATPKPTEHLTVDVADPRSIEPAQLSGNVEEKWR
jgi:mannose-6-phosphate isomerase-like protein (cupin superfamily)